MKPSHESQPYKPSEPSKLSKPRKPETGPFILEDDDDELVPMAISEDYSASLNAPPTLSQGLPEALREISPNTPQHRAEGGADDQSKKAERPTESIVEQEILSPQHSRHSSPIKENDLPPAQPPDKLQEDIAEVLKRQNASSNSNSTAPVKRKSRPLGRNISSISNRSGSMTAVPSIPADVFEENSAADGYDYSNVVPVQPPSTQLGYDTPEAEAHRQQMSKKMGTAVLEDEGVGRRVASVGTVKDSTSRAAGGARAKGRSRTKT